MSIKNMNNLSLEILEEYAKVLTLKQTNKLYESKTGKTYQKQLFEDSKELKMKLDPITIFKETKMQKAQFANWLNENYAPLMNNIAYKISSEGIEFKTYDRNLYRKLQESLMNAGFSSKKIVEIRDKKF